MPSGSGIGGAALCSAVLRLKCFEFCERDGISEQGFVGSALHLLGFLAAHTICTVLTLDSSEWKEGRRNSLAGIG